MPGRGSLSFKSKTINGKRYWYLYISLGASRREHYLGQESTELLDKMDDERAAWESTSPVVEDPVGGIVASTARS